MVQIIKPSPQKRGLYAVATSNCLFVCLSPETHGRGATAINAITDVFYPPRKSSFPWIYAHVGAYPWHLWMCHICSDTHSYEFLSLHSLAIFTSDLVIPYILLSTGTKQCSKFEANACITPYKETGSLHVLRIYYKSLWNKRIVLLL